ncbi:MAG: type IV pilus twitching motility protein PilT [Nitrospirae bacterium]|nr:type IV pilus twitching motility protein PilT [Nitrospirota bacterium]
MILEPYLRFAIQVGASDLHIKVGSQPILRINGKLVPVKNGKRMNNEELTRAAYEVLNDEQKVRLERLHEVDLALSVAGLGRFRANVFHQRGSIEMALRVVPFGVGTIESLNLPKVIEKLADAQRGMILVTGTTGSGKSTTLATMVERINTRRTCHIVTIEDPIEFLLKDNKSIVTQREIGQDTTSFASGLRSALRQDPDVIMVGEMRDVETVEVALQAAETGHLVLSTVHTLDATETINRVISFFPLHQHQQVRFQLAAVLRGIVSQRLLPKTDGKGRIPAAEVLVVNGAVRECILNQDRTKEIPQFLAKGYSTYGMQTFDQSLMQLYSKQLITYEEALRSCTNPDDFALRVKGVHVTGEDLQWKDFEQKQEKDSEPEFNIDI